MNSSAHRWIRLLTLSALLVLTAGIAAAPVRNFVLPLASRQLQLWGLVGASVPAASVPSDRTSSTAGKLDGDIGLIAMAEPASYSTAAGTATAAKDDKDSNNSAASNGRAADDDRTRGSNRSRNSRNAWSARLNGRQVSNAGSNSSRQAGESLSRNGGSSASNDAGESGNRGNHGLFAEHTAGLPELTGGKNKTDGSESPGGRAGGSHLPNVAANPEPSTLLLLGTGLAAGFGAIRRRLRSR